MPSVDDDKDHAKILTTTKAAATTTISHPSQATNTHDAEATDHPARPTKIKPSQSDVTKPSETAKPSGTQGAQESPTNTNWVSWLPSFGVSEKAQAWIYGALALIVLFCLGLGGWFFWQRRRKANNNRDNYEFELINEEEAEGLNRSEKGAAGGKGRRTRGGELYDAFAGGSDDDDEDFIPGAYRDQERSRSQSRDGRGGRGGRGAEEEEQQHVIGGDSDDETYDEKQRR